jgi:3-hydroxybutyryl-CoA dehydrogenase
MSKEVAVIGAGTMGNGIAHVFAMSGWKVNLIDVSAQALDKGIQTISKNLDRMVAKGKIDEKTAAETLQKIQKHSEMATGVGNCDLIVEAATENPQLKMKIFSELSRLAPPKALLATNTSSISITQIAANTDRPEQVIGMHFMNPVPIMKLVEVIRGYATSDQTCVQIMNISRDLGKIPVEVNDYPGFVSNRILMPMINEAIETLFEGVAGVEEIDQVMMLGMAHPMGPLHLADYIGLDVCLAILRVMHDGFGRPKYAPCPLLVNMVAAGKLGVKSGEGFYFYDQSTKEKKTSPYFNR